jgi:hypothetical protein
VGLWHNGWLFFKSDGEIASRIVLPNFSDAHAVVAVDAARLYVNGAEPPCLIVRDLNLSEKRGQIALRVGTDTEGHFSKLTVNPAH